MDLGFRFAFSILVWGLGGYWLDTKLSTLPLFFILGALLGTASGFLTVYRAVFPSQSKDKQNSDD
ncbi:MAG: AtpZ/AtpI family protein [Deferribacteres bacterium]|nr:AtpZ/AtpI family protein [candidate division KSB1 bacterium]MCB9511750.1 AtpZ/AtpI family protein [Deferribacteres bacterium]